ncbi:MAG: proton-conducting transporter membrane subunit, partial [Planctomycetota bacterium]
MILLALILVPIIAAAAIALAPSAMSKAIASVGAIAQLGVALVAAFTYPWLGGDEPSESLFTVHASINEFLGINLSMGVDSVAMWLIMLTAFLTPLMVFGSFTAITERVKTYYAWLLALQGVIVAVFGATDMLLFYIAFEFTLIPMFILIYLYGSSNRQKAAIKFFLYTFTGSIIMLAGLVYVAFKAQQLTGEWSFAYVDMMNAARSMSAVEQAWVLGALMLGFGVKVPIFPFHTWLPLAHTEAPTAGSVILAGVLLKLGTYAIYK